MADEDHGPRLGRQRLCQPLLHLGAGDGVERGERLVQQEHGLAGQKRAEKRDPLAHAAGQLRRPRPLEACEPEALEEGVGFAAGGAPRGAPVPQRKRGIVDRREPGQEQVALRHVGAALQASGAVHLTVDRDLARGWLPQAADELQQRRLPAPRRPDDAQDLAGLDAKVHPLDDLELTERMPEAIHLDPRHRSRRVAARGWSARRAAPLRHSY